MGRLPFLQRALRVGFTAACDAAGLATTPALRVLAAGEARAGHDEYAVFELWSRPPVDAPPSPGEDHRVRRTMKMNIGREGWSCPLCVLHGELADREMLVAHLDWDHAEVDVLWEGGDERPGVDVGLLSRNGSCTLMS
jgi:hypothetical protein